jgi:exonuclease III
VELIPGRAIAPKIKWHESEETTLINVYTPNNKLEHPNLWGRIELEHSSRGMNPPDFLLGDFNVTEDLIDRAPIHHDNENTIEALRNLRHQLNLEDVWRQIMLRVNDSYCST